MKRNILFFFFLTSCLYLNGQVLELEKKTNTRAVVIGISDYQDPEIPDLRYADIDAIEFANFLKDESGANLTDDNIILLTNQSATAGQVVSALYWLIEESQEGDRAYIYFSGHGDVEGTLYGQPGYLLCWDAPSSVYMIGGTIGLVGMKTIVSTLSLQKKAKVILITDACRSGKLAGSDNGGVHITGANLAKQFANEMKILSCQPEEYSYEGDQWGGGRGAFSFHLVNGLYGLADENGDQQVSLMEISRYIQDKVGTEVAPHNQIPMTIGPPNEKIASVSPENLKKAISNDSEEVAYFSAVESRGIEDEVLEQVDSFLNKLYITFKTSLEEKRFFSPEDDCSEYYYEKLMQSHELERLHSSIRRNYAAALQDDAQQVLNDLLKTKVGGEKLISTSTSIIQYSVYPNYLKRAQELLGKDHYMYTPLEGRKLYFEGIVMSLGNENPNRELGRKAIEKFNAALTFQPDMPQVYLGMSKVYYHNLIQPDSGKYYADLASKILPNWVKPYTSTAFVLIEKYKNYELAKTYLDKANQLDSNAIFVLNAWAIFYYRQHNFNLAEKYYKKCIEIDPNFFIGLSNLGGLYFENGDFENGEKYLLKAIEVDSSYASAYTNLGYLYNELNLHDKAIEYCLKSLEIDPLDPGTYNNLGNAYNGKGEHKLALESYLIANKRDSLYVSAYSNIGRVYMELNDFIKAEFYARKGIEIDSLHANNWSCLGVIYARTKRTEQAIHFFEKAIELNPLNATDLSNLSAMYLMNGQQKEAEMLLIKSIAINPHDDTAHYNLACFKSLDGNIEEGYQHLEKSIKFGYDDYEWINKDTDLENLRLENKRWNKLMKKYFPNKLKE